MKEVETIMQNKFQISMDDKLHHGIFFKDFIQGERFLYQGFINKILTMLFPGLEDNIE